MFWNAIKEQLTPSRIVPVVGFVVTAGVTAVTGYLAANGFNLDPAIVTGIVVPVALGGLASVLHWQKGWQAYEERGAAAGAVVESYDVHPEDLIPDVDDLDSEKAKGVEQTTTHRRHSKGDAKNG